MRQVGREAPHPAECVGRALTAPSLHSWPEAAPSVLGLQTSAWGCLCRKPSWFSPRVEWKTLGGAAVALCYLALSGMAALCAAGSATSSPSPVHPSARRWGQPCTPVSLPSAYSTLHQPCNKQPGAPVALSCVLSPLVFWGSLPLRFGLAGRVGARAQEAGLPAPHPGFATSPDPSRASVSISAKQRRGQ